MTMARSRGWMRIEYLFRRVTWTPRKSASRIVARCSRVKKTLRNGHGTATRGSEEHTSELQSPCNLVCRLLLEKKKTKFIVLYPVVDMIADLFMMRVFSAYSPENALLKASVVERPASPLMGLRVMSRQVEIPT